MSVFSIEEINHSITMPCKAFHPTSWPLNGPNDTFALITCTQIRIFLFALFLYIENADLSDQTARQQIIPNRIIDKCPHNPSFLIFYFIQKLGLGFWNVVEEDLAGWIAEEKTGLVTD